MDNFSFKFLKDFNTPPKASGVCYLVIYSYLVISRPSTPITAQVSRGDLRKLVMLLVQAGYAFGASWLCFWCKLVMLLVQAGYAFGASWLCQRNIKYV